MSIPAEQFETVRGFPMNADGRKMVAHPDTGDLVAYWGASDWPLDGPYTGDPIHGERGTWLHEFVAWCAGHRSADGLKAERERLGIPADVARHIAEDWRRFVAEHAIEVDHVEHPSVADRWEIASPVDLVGRVGGQPAVIDIKTASSPRKVAYAVQLTYYRNSQAYDPDTGQRKEWT